MLSRKVCELIKSLNSEDYRVYGGTNAHIISYPIIYPRLGTLFGATRLISLTPFRRGCRLRFVSSSYNARPTKRDANNTHAKQSQREVKPIRCPNAYHRRIIPLRDLPRMFHGNASLPSQHGGLDSRVDSKADSPPDASRSINKTPSYRLVFLGQRLRREER